MTALPAVPWTLDNVPGRFPEVDIRLFDWLLGYQSRSHVQGDLLELGVDLGKSAILIGRYLREGERFTVCDPFEGDAEDRREPGRNAFETNYLAYHDRLPEIVQEPSSAVLDHVKPESCRFVHIGVAGSREQVLDDLATARRLTTPAGLVAVSDHHEGSPAAEAVLAAVAGHGLRPVCVSSGTFYGTWGDPAAVLGELATWLGEHPDEWAGMAELLAGQPVIRADRRSTPPTAADPELDDETGVIEAIREADETDEHREDDETDGTGQEERREQTLPFPAYPTSAPRWTDKGTNRTRRKKKTLRRKLMKLLPNRLRRRMRRKW